MNLSKKAKILHRISEISDNTFYINKMSINHKVNKWEYFR